MIRKITIVVSLCVIAVLSMTAISSAANSFTFNETYKQNNNCVVIWGIPFCDNNGVGGKFTITGKISLNGIDITKFNKDTSFIIVAGGFSFEALLGDDYIYSRTPGKTSFSVSYIDRLEESDKPIKYITIKLKWTSKLLTMTVTGLTPDFIYPIIADYYVGDATHSFADSTIAYVELGDLYSGFNMNYSGKVTTKNIKKKDGKDYTTSSVTVKGKGTETSEDFREGEPVPETVAVQ